MVFYILPNLLPKTDKRYKKWLKSLEKRPTPWNKGFTKESHPSIAKTVRTFQKKKIDNFANWRRKMIETGKIKIDHPPLKRSGDLAELIGVTLGDGHIGKFPRTEILAIFSNRKNKGFIKRYSLLIAKIFKKKASQGNHGQGCIKISIYEKDIGKRLSISTGSRKDLKIDVPDWIKNNKRYLKRYLRGLYEAEGSFCVHKPTYTYKFLFSNRNESLLKNVYDGLKILGFHPHKSQYQIQISRKAEVYKIKDLIKFRQY